MKLSLCLATYNEEENIHYPLDSAYHLVDEVVIVDGGSTDSTVEKARSYGKKVKIIKTNNPKMFHLNKQKAIDQAKGEWILQLDADEALTDKLKEEIKMIVNQKDNPFVAYWLPRKNFFLNRFLLKGGQYPDYTIRLYKNKAAYFPCQDVHENVKVKEGKIGYLKNPILHYADPDFSRYLARFNRYTSLEVESEEFQNKNKNKDLKLMFVEYFFFKPVVTFFSMYFRHKGFADGFPGFVFALFSSIRFWAIYIKYWTKRHQKKIKFQP